MSVKVVGYRDVDIDDGFFLKVLFEKGRKHGASSFDDLDRKAVLMGVNATACDPLACHSLGPLSSKAWLLL